MTPARRAAAASYAAAVALACAAAPAADAARPAPPQPEFVLWSGGMGPEDALRGFRLFPDGKLQVLESAGADRTANRIKVVGTLKPGKAQLKTIRARAKAATKAPAVTTAQSPDRVYTTATIKVGDKLKTVLAVNTTEPALTALVDSVNATQPTDRRIHPRVLARELNIPDRADCVRGTATDFKRRLTLKEAAEAGAVELTSKGSYNGDVVAIDADWDKVPVRAPVKVEVKIEFIRESVYALPISDLEARIEQRFGPLKTAAGTAIEVDVIPKERVAGDPPTPCYHQIRIADDVERSYVTGAGYRPTVHPEGGEWSAQASTDTLAHETLHLLGIDDQYDDYFKSGNHEVMVPDAIDSTDKAALDAWAQSQMLDPVTGYLYSKPKPGHENDLAANLTGKVIDSDLQKFVDWVDQIDIHGEAGDILISKKNATANSPDSEQNLVMGSDIDVNVTRDGHERRDGIVAYCMDAGRPSPSQGTKYDVLGNAGEMQHPAMQAVYKITQLADERQPAELELTPGAQNAVWRVTDDYPVDRQADPDAAAILDAVGVDPNASQDPGAPTFAAPHFINPNAASPNTGAVTESGVVQPELSSPPVVGTPLPPPVLTALLLDRKKIKSGGKGLDSVVGVRVALAAAGDTLQVRLEQVKGGKVRVVKAFGPQVLDAGNQSFAIVLPKKLQAGAYQVTVEGKGGKRSAPLKVTAAKKKKARGRR